jgi:hypothetical protein
MAAPPMVHRRKRRRGTFISTQRGCSFVLEVGGSDDRPPFLDLGLLLRDKCLRRLLVSRRDVLALIIIVAVAGVGSSLNTTFTSVQTALK